MSSFTRLRRKIGLLILMLACIGGCLCLLIWRNWQSSVPSVDAATSVKLESFAEESWRNRKQKRSIPKDDWPFELRQLAPQSVFVEKEGVFIQFGEFFVSSWGLFILPKNSEFQPEQSGDPSFRKVHNRVYKYENQGLIGIGHVDDMTFRDRPNNAGRILIR